MSDGDLGLHVGIVSWRGFHERASRIAEEILDVCETITVVYSGDEEVLSSDYAKWVRTDDADFFGRKMSILLKGATEEVFLLIQADAKVENWEQLAEHCRAAFVGHPELGVWSPEIDHTPLPTALTRFTHEDAAGFTDVIQTDGIVLAFRQPVVEFLVTLDYHDNNLGWGIDYAAIAYCLATGRRAVRDASQHVQHPPGTGYNTHIAMQQMHAFLSKLPLRERRIATLLVDTVRRRREAQKYEKFSRTGENISTAKLINKSLNRVLLKFLGKN